MTAFDPDRPTQPALSEWEIYADHRAALDATLFAPDYDPVEVRLGEAPEQLRARLAAAVRSCHDRVPAIGED